MLLLVVIVAMSCCLGLLVFAAHVEAATGRIVFRTTDELIEIIGRSLRELTVFQGPPRIAVKLPAGLARIRGGVWWRTGKGLCLLVELMSLGPF